MVRRLMVTAVVAGLAGCTVGPDYVRPEVALPERFVEAPAGATQAVPGELWSSLGNEELDRLITRALQANTTIAQALARLDETRAYAGLTTYSLFPTVTANASAERSQPSSKDPFIPPNAVQRTDTYRAGFDASWEIDLFGSLRNQSNQIFEEVEANTAALRDVQLSITAEVAQTWFALRGAEQLLALREQQSDNLRSSVELQQTLLDAGRGNSLDLARIQTLAAVQAAQVAPAEAERVRQEQRLAALTGWSIETLREQLAPAAELMPLPPLSTVGSPDEWLLRRPDVRAAERRIAAAYSDIGFETAQYFPILTLNGSYGWTAQAFGNLGNSGSDRSTFGPSLSWRFLDFGRVRQYVRAAEARANGAIAAYQEAVLRALEDVENSFAGLRAANQSAIELARAQTSSADALRLSRLRLDAGASSYLDVLDSERTHLDLQTQALQARIRQATALVVVYKALAGDFAVAESADLSERRISD